MTSEPEFRTDLYRGTARYYDRFRPPYPEALFEDLRHRLPVSGSGRLLDLACGTGQIAFALAEHFRQVVAVDQDAESVAFARTKAEGTGVRNIRWIAGPAETATLDGPFELIAVGNAFHRLNRPLVAARMRSWVQPGGGVALVWGDSPWRGDSPWQNAMEELVAEWMTKAGATDRVPAGWESALQQDPHERVLCRTGFDYVGKFEFTTEQTWTVETLTGYVFSTSGLSRQALGSKAAEFERDLAQRIGSYSADGRFHQLTKDAYQLARLPEPSANVT